MFQRIEYREKASFEKKIFTCREIYVGHLLTSEMTIETHHQDLFYSSSTNEHHCELEMSGKREVKCWHQLKKSLSHLTKIYLCNSITSN